MKPIKYDKKLPGTFSGQIEYTKTDYIANTKCNFILTFNHGNLTQVYLKEKNKYLNPDKWNQDFWIKAPLYANYDDGCWKRQNIIFYSLLNSDSKVTINVGSL